MDRSKCSVYIQSELFVPSSLNKLNAYDENAILFVDWNDLFNDTNLGNQKDFVNRNRPYALEWKKKTDHNGVVSLVAKL